MAIFTTADGRQIVGAAQAGNEYKGYAGRREIVIQLTSDGATQDSLDALEFLKSYAVYHNSVGEPIFPASTNVFISNNGVTKAVEADEVTVDGANVNIGGCVWNGTAWDFTNAGQGGGGSSGGGVLVVNVTADPETEETRCDKTAGEIMAVVDAGGSVVFKEVNELPPTSRFGYMTTAIYENQSYLFVTMNDSYTASSASDYPVGGGK